MPQIQFTVTEEAAAYLRWYARTILFEKADNGNAAARHLMMARLEQIRRDRNPSEPSTQDLAVPDTQEIDAEN